MVKVRPSELVLIVSDSNHKNIYEALCSAFESVGVTPSVFLLPDCIRPISKFPQLLRDALPRADIVLSVLDRSFEEQSLQMALIQIAKKSGARVASLPDVTDEIFTSSLFDVNYAQVSDRTSKVYNILKSVDTIEVTSEAGTNITLKPSEYLHDNTGFLFEPGKCGNLPGGMVSFEPVLESLNGKIVVDGAITGQGLVETPVEFEVVDGVVEEIPKGAEFLKELFSMDRAAKKICEFGIGTNHGAEL
ncbi:MAG: aminopeptidase, partial [Candidatus Diapherotrites archaeon]|nr:aminopeptidase [Candidatus Diapherotrites archaeon]